MSSWKRMIRPMTPTDTNLSRMLPNSFISSTCETTSQKTTNTRIPMKTFSERDSFMRR